MTIRVVANELRPAASEDEYRLHCAALEWSLAEPIIINSAEDIKSRADWRDKVEPYQHQVQNLMRFCRRLPVTLLADDVGLGKTISAGLIVSELMKRSRVAKVFVICPKILVPQWIEELDSKFGISACEAIGNQLRNVQNRKESVIVTTYHSASGFLEKNQPGTFDMLILDEAHKVRNLHGTNSPPRMATAIYGALEARHFKYVLMLTATPIQNRLWDIYSLVDCLAVARGHTNPFGDPGQFGSRYIDDSVTVARRLQPEHAEEFRRIVSTYMFRTRRIDARLAFPERKVQACAVNATPGELQMQRVIADHIDRFNGLQQVSLLVALMSSPRALAAQLNNMASAGTADPELSETIANLEKRIDTPAKADMVLKIAGNLRGQKDNWRMVVFTTRKETQRMLGEVLERNGIKYGFISGGEPTKNRATISSFRNEPPGINVIISTDAGAEGVNLQSANILVNYDLPWNPMIVEQRIGRVQRIGSQFKNVWVANIVHNNSPEQRIVCRLMEKLQVISHTVGDIEAVLEATDDSDGESLEKQIREMVVASLKGQDQEAAARLAEQSIAKAKLIIEQNQRELDTTLGHPSEGDSADIPMPRLKPATPSLPYQDFVLQALKVENHKIERAAEAGLYISKSSGLGEERFTFDEQVLQRFTQAGVFMGRVPVLYQPGKPAFERLVQRWIDRGAAKIDDLRASSELIRDLANQWIRKFPGANVVDAKVSQRLERFQGRLICRTRVSNAIDSYEKLIPVPCESGDNQFGSSTDLNGSIQVRRLAPTIDEQINRCVDEDPDVTQFRKYYEERLKAELQRSDSGDRRAKLENDLFPSLSADTSALTGSISDQAQIAIAYTVDSDEVYRSTLLIKDGVIVVEPPLERCELTDRMLPVDCLEQCNVTGKRVLREKLRKSEVSGAYALPESFATCEITGKKVHAGELGVCARSQRHVCQSLLQSSEASGRKAISDYIKACELTGSQVLDDELVRSSLSGRMFRVDQSVVLDDGQTAQVSEARKCDFTGKWYPKADCVKSEASGKYLHAERVTRSELSGRACDESEIVQCEISGRNLLPDETDTCAISKKQVDRQLLSKCEETGQLAQTALMHRCEETGNLVLPDCLGECCLTGKRVRKSLLGSSNVSGRTCLSERLVQCEKSLIRLLPDEVGICSLTEKQVDRRLLQTCTATGQLALQSEMVQSKATGRWFLPAYTEKLPNGMQVGRGEVAACAWTRKYLRTDQTATCALCGLVFSKALMNASGEFSLLRECLDGKQKGTLFPEPGYLARVMPKVFTGVAMFNWISSENSKSHILFGTKSTFGFNTKAFAVVAIGDLTGLKLQGEVLFGKRIKGVWQPIEVPELKA